MSGLGLNFSLSLTLLLNFAEIFTIKHNQRRGRAFEHIKITMKGRKGLFVLYKYNYSWKIWRLWDLVMWTLDTALGIETTTMESVGKVRDSGEIKIEIHKNGG